MSPPKSVKSHSALSVAFTVLQGVHRTPGRTIILYIWVTQMIRSAPKILAVPQRDKQSLSLAKAVSEAAKWFILRCLKFYVFLLWGFRTGT